jgi:hypothetical protein
LPSTLNCTAATETLSVAFAWIGTVPRSTAPFEGEVMVTAGGEVSAGGVSASVVADAGADCSERLPLLSKAATV